MTYYVKPVCNYHWMKLSREELRKRLGMKP